MNEIISNPIFLAIFAVVTGIGANLSVLFLLILPKFIKKIENEMPIGVIKTTKEGYKFCPLDCSEHQAEHERSLRNEMQINKLWEEFAKLDDKLDRRLEVIKDNQNYILMGLVRAKLIDPPERLQGRD